MDTDRPVVQVTVEREDKFIESVTLYNLSDAQIDRLIDETNRKAVNTGLRWEHVFDSTANTSYIILYDYPYV